MYPITSIRNWITSSGKGKEADEQRFRKLDETIRNLQKARQEAAAAQIQEVKTKNRRRFSKHKQTKQ